MRVHLFPAFVVPQHCTCPSFGSFPPGVEVVEDSLSLDVLGGAEGRLGVLLGVPGFDPEPFAGLLLADFFEGPSTISMEGVKESSLSGVMGR